MVLSLSSEAPSSSPIGGVGSIELGSNRFGHI